MVNGSQVIGMSGSTFDAFVSSQRGRDETDWAAKIQEKYWRARQKFLAKIERNEDSSIVLSDAKLDSKLGIYKSVDRSCARLTNILESYQNCLFVFSNEENALGILLKECGKHDKTKAGKIMSVTGRSLTQSSHQRIRLYMPLMRLYQEMETFHSRAVEDTSETVNKLEGKRSQYRASLLWMKDISEKLDPDVYKQLDKFRRVQNKVRDDKRAFDGLQMDVVQKIDLLMASRCNLMNQILASYQATLLETFERNYNNFKSVRELIEQEDIYEYEFKALKQLNPLKIDDDDSPRHSDLQRLKTSQEQASSPEANVAAEQDLLGVGDDLSERHEKDGNNNARQGDNLVDVSGEGDSELQATSGLGSTESIDNNLLDSLFGDHQENQPGAQRRVVSDDEPQSSGVSSLRQRKSTKPGEYKDMLPNLDANLFDIEGDEDKQIASLLEPSLNSRSDANLYDLMTMNPMTNPIEEDDIFAKWARDADIDLSNTGDELQQETPLSKTTGDNTLDGSSKDLMDIKSDREVSNTKGHRSRFYA